MSDLTNRLTELASDFIANDGEHFLVSVERAGANSRRYLVIIDGDKGVSIDYCSQLSRHISRRLDEELPENAEAFTFEVTSPGVDRPLLMERQYPKHIGRTIRFTDTAGKEVKGKLAAVSDGQITLEVEVSEKGKKPRYEEQHYPIKEIKEPKIIVSFK